MSEKENVLLPTHPYTKPNPNQTKTQNFYPNDLILLLNVLDVCYMEKSMLSLFYRYMTYIYEVGVILTDNWLCKKERGTLKK